MSDPHPAPWNLADVWEAVADTVPDAPALIHADRTVSWSAFDDRAARLAAVFDAAGLRPGSKVAHYLYNGPEYIEATFAAFKCRAVPVNVNYRYTEHELRYLFANSDAEAIVVDDDLAPHVDALLPELTKVRLVVRVGPNGDYEQRLASVEPMPRIDRRGDDLWFLYTGGTTGMPKGVMWPHSSLLGTAAPTFAGFGLDLPSSPAEAAAAAAAIHGLGGAAAPRGDGPLRLLPPAPLMHRTAAIARWGVLSSAGAIVTVPERHLDAGSLLGAIEAHRGTNLTIVGDAFAKPIVAALEAAERAGRPVDLTSLTTIVSSGVMWSQATKDALMARADVVCADLLGSSEGVGFARSVARRGRSARTASFRLGEHARVFTEDGRAVEPGSGERGLLAVGGPIPIGYYGDPVKSAETFRTFAGRVWSVPGDWATVEADGVITLLGRGSVCINTAGEKVFPEEVEEVLKTHPGVLDANVVGVDDEKWGQAVCAVVALDGDRSVDETELIAHCRSTLAGYKCPKRVILVPRVERGPNGKADYRWARSVAENGPT